MLFAPFEWSCMLGSELFSLIKTVKTLFQSIFPSWRLFLCMGRLPWGSKLRWHFRIMFRVTFFLSFHFECISNAAFAATKKRTLRVAPNAFNTVLLLYESFQRQRKFTFESKPMFQCKNKDRKRPADHARAWWGDEEMRGGNIKPSVRFQVSTWYRLWQQNERKRERSMAELTVRDSLIWCQPRPIKTIRQGRVRRRRTTMTGRGRWTGELDFLLMNVGELVKNTFVNRSRWTQRFTFSLHDNNNSIIT